MGTNFLIALMTAIASASVILGFLHIGLKIFAPRAFKQTIPVPKQATGRILTVDKDFVSWPTGHRLTADSLPSAVRVLQQQTDAVVASVVTELAALGRQESDFQRRTRQSPQVAQSAPGLRGGLLLGQNMPNLAEIASSSIQ
jgi:hypothetical protein